MIVTATGRTASDLIGYNGVWLVEFGPGDRITWKCAHTHGSLDDASECASRALRVTLERGRSVVAPRGVGV